MSDVYVEPVFNFFFLDTKFASFQRQLNLYGFRRIIKGKDHGAYFHPSFKQNSPHLIPEIKRLTKKSSNAVTYEPNLNFTGESLQEMEANTRNRRQKFFFVNPCNFCRVFFIIIKRFK